MARKVNQVLWDQWRRRIERQHASGLSIAEFCRRAARSGKGRAITRARRRLRHTMAKPAMSLYPKDFLQLPVAAAPTMPWIELAMADGTILRLPQQNLAALITALRVLRGERLELPPGESRHA